MVIHRLHGRLAHLLALTPPRRRLDLRLLTVMLPEADIHVLLHIGHVLQNVVDHALLDRPSEEIQLAHGGLLNRRLAADLEADALPSAKRIKQPLRIGLELALVVEMHHELARARLVRNRIADVELLGIIGDEPVNQP